MRSSPTVLVILLGLSAAAAASAEGGAAAGAAVQIVEHGEYEPRSEAGKQRAGGTSLGYVGVVDASADPWELVPGRWTMQVLDGDEVVAEQGFEVVPTGSPEAEELLAVGHPADPLERLPEELWERATLIVAGRYEEGRSPCIWVGEDTRVWLRIQGFAITDRLRGEVRGDYVGIDLTEPPQTSYVCAECLVPGREYLLLLRPSPESLRFLDTEDEALYWENVLGGEELLAIVEIPAGRPSRIAAPAAGAAASLAPAAGGEPR
jgi:hypothetical protein